MRQAGLNPNLVYGNGVDGNQSAAPNVGIANRSQNSDFGFAESVANVFRRRQIENETRLAAANEQNILAQQLLNTARYMDVMQDVARKDATYETYVQKAAADLQHTNQAIEESRQRVAESKQRVTNLKETIKQIHAITRNYDARTITEKLRPNEVRAHTRLMSEQATTSAKQRELYDSIIALNDQKIDQLIMMIDLMSSQKYSIDLENEMTAKMRELGIQGASGKDILQFVKDLIIQLIK